MKHFLYLLVLLYIGNYVSYLIAHTSLAERIELSVYEQELYEYHTYKELLHSGLLHKQNGEAQQALSYLKAAVKKKPTNPEANWHLGDCYLLFGDYERGLMGFNWRWFGEPHYNNKLWQGQNLTGKKILIFCQWGFGDTFMYIRYAKLLKKLCCTVLCVSQKPLLPLLCLCPYIDYCCSSFDTIPVYDYQVPLSYLPEIFSTRVDTIPNETPYLFVHKELEQKWNSTISHETFNIGICWHGADRNDPQMKLRSIPLTMLEPLFLLPHTTIYSLQQQEGIEQISTLPPHCSLHTFDATFDKTYGSFMDTAAVIKNLDLIITIDTSIAHLAGALDVPVWVMLPYANEWRFLRDRTDSPWYPSMRLFRQSSKKCWHEVITNVVTALKEILNQERL